MSKLKLLALSGLLLVSLLAFGGAQTPSWVAAADSEETNSEEVVDFSVTDVSVDIDGWRVDPNLEEVIDDALRSREERNREASSAASAAASTTRHPFDKSCPYGYFTCTNGECIAKRWRCDGHYDCDDFSDELNCTTLDIPHAGSILPASSTYVPPPPPRPTASQAASAISVAGATPTQTPPKSLGALEFNSTVEPLMVFSTGSSIRGFWMRSRIYFDVVTRNKPHSPSSAQTSITDAFSIFFGILGGSQSAASSAQSATSGSSSSATSSKPPVHPGKPDTTIVGLDMDPGNKEVYWVELGKEPGVYSAIIEDEQFEARHKRQHRSPKKVVEFGLLSPEDLALDTVGRNVYITDAGLPAVVVCSYVHVNCKIIVEDNIHKPRAIIVDSATGWVTFSDWGDRPGIYLVSMEGKRRETLVDNEIVWPNGLASDPTTNSLYWADARLQKIERVDLKTRRREIVIREASTNPFSVSLFENRIYWSDWSQNEIKTCNKFTGNDTRVLMHAEDIYGIHIYHSELHSRRASSDDPCWSKHCSHMCLLSPATSTFATRASLPLRATCACPDYMTLSVFDRATCIEMETPMVLLNVRNFIATFWPDRIGLRVIEEIVHSSAHAIQDMAADWHHYRIYFYDAATRYIFEADFSGRRPYMANMTQAEGHSLRGLTHDWMSDNLYWLDNQAGTLTMYSLKGAFQRVLRRDLARPTSLVLDSKNRLLYIACVDNANPHILRTDMTGSEQTDVVIASQGVNGGLGLPVALHLDEQLQRLYWADAKTQTIESIELDIKSHSTGTRMNSRQVHRRSLGLIVSFTVFQDSFVWTASGDPYLYKARIAPSKHMRPVTFKMPPNPLARTFPEIDYRRLITINLNVENSASACHTTPCSHGCILDSTHEPKCICPDGLKLSINNRTNCIEATKQEECLNCLPPAVTAAALVHQPTAGALSHNSVVPGSGVALSNIIKHLDGRPGSSTPASAPAQPLSPPEHKKLEDTKSEDWIFQHSLGLDHPHQDHSHSRPGESAAVHSQEGASSSSSSSTEDQGGNKMVWLIVFILILSAAGLVTMLSLLMLHKQGRLQNPVAVSFIAPDRDKDRAMLLLDTDIE